MLVLRFSRIGPHLHVPLRLVISGRSLVYTLFHSDQDPEVKYGSSMSLSGEDWNITGIMPDTFNFTGQRDARIQLQPGGFPSSTPSTMPALPRREFELSPPKLDFEFRMAARLKREVCKVQLRNEEVRDLSVIEGGEWVAGFGRGTVRVGFS